MLVAHGHPAAVGQVVVAVALKLVLEQREQPIWAAAAVGVVEPQTPLMTVALVVQAL
jgi:hypothetical protein